VATHGTPNAHAEPRIQTGSMEGVLAVPDASSVRGDVFLTDRTLSICWRRSECFCGILNLLRTNRNLNWVQEVRWNIESEVCGCLLSSDIVLVNSVGKLHHTQLVQKIPAENRITITIGNAVHSSEKCVASIYDSSEKIQK